MIEKILLSIAVLISVISLSLVLTYHPEIEIPIKLPISLENYEKVKDIDVTFENNYAIITLYTDCYKLRAYVEDVQGKSILNGKLGKRDIRPNSHDVIKDVFEEFGIEVLSVRITDLKNNTYFAEMDVKQKKKVVSIDIRPSDGIAIALRTNTPIYIKKDLLEEKGEKIC